jgi:hypothetical protein
MQAIGDFVFPDGGGVSGISIFAQNGILAELEVHAMSEETPMELPNPDDLLTYDSPRALELVSLHMPDQ